MRAGLHRMSGARLSGPTRLLLCSALAFLAAPACAEVGATLTLTSQDRFRGYSVSDGYPAVTFSLSYDDAAGPYVEGSVMVAGNSEMTRAGQAEIASSLRSSQRQLVVAELLSSQLAA